MTDAAKGKTSYTYGAFNTLRTATDPGGATTKWTLDALGRPRKIEDPDRGTTTIVHDGFGELVTQADQLMPAAERAVASRLPACLNVMIEGLPAPNIRR